MNRTKNNVLFMLYTIILGLIVGLIIWGFLRIMNYGVEFLWGYLPSLISFPLYTVCVCTAGGLIIGIWKRKFGDYPEELTGVIVKIKKTGRYHYNNVFSKYKFGWTFFSITFQKAESFKSFKIFQYASSKIVKDWDKLHASWRQFASYSFWKTGLNLLSKAIEFFQSQKENSII